MDSRRSLNCAVAVFLAALIFVFTTSPAGAQSIGDPCSTAGWTSHVVSSSTGELLVCNGSTWGLSEAFTSGGNVGIGTASPTAPLHISEDLDGGQALIEISGQYGAAVNLDNQDRTNIAGMAYYSVTGLLNVFSPNGIKAYTGNNAGTLVAQFGNGTTNDKTTYLSGNVGIGSASPVSSLDLSQKTDAVALPSGTVSQRPTAVNGMLRYDSSTPALEAYVNGAWETLVTGTGSTSTITIGTSASATNPQRSGDATTGLFSAATGQVSIASVGTEVGRWTSTGLNITLAPSAGTYQGSLQINGNNAIWQDATNYNLAVGKTAFPTTVSQSGGGQNGQFNTAVGVGALNSNTTGQENTAVGYEALYLNTTGIYNTALGLYALQNNSTGSQNTALGEQALYLNTTGSYNTAAGYTALASNTTGSYNTATGRSALYSNTTGIDNTASGFAALYTNTTGSYNTAAGYYALYYDTGSYNTASGYGALFNNTTGVYNAALGYNALTSNTTGAFNTATGTAALGHNTAGGNNTAAGYGALNINTTGNDNTAVGYEALFQNTTGTNNTVLGYNVASTTLQTGSNNILIGTSSAVDTAAAGTNYNLNIGNLLQGNMTNSTALGTEALYLQSTSGSVNYLQIAGAATTAAPVLSAQGTDTNISINVTPKGIGSTNFTTGNVGIGTTSPNTTLQVNGGVSVGVVTVTSNYTATSANYLILCNPKSGGLTVTLPPAQNKGQIIIIKDIGTSNNCSFQTQGSDTLGDTGATSSALGSYSNPQASFVADGVSSWWFLVMPGTTH